MPNIFFKGNQILPNSATCPAEVVSNSVVTYCNPFFRNNRPNMLSNTEGQILCVFSGRNYIKHNSELAYVGYFYNSSGYTGPILVGRTQESVAFRTNYVDSILQSIGSLNYNGTTYYYSNTGLFMGGNLTSSGGSATYKCSATNVVDAAMEILNIIGRVEINGVTDSGYHLVSADSNTLLNPCKVDAFENKLKINGNNCQFCKKGYAPVGNYISEYGVSTIYLHKHSSGKVSIDSNTSGSEISTISTAAEGRKIFTFLLQGGGGGGSSGNGGLFGSNNDGEGGSAGGTVIVTLDISKLGEYTRIEIGSAGNGAERDRSTGYNGSPTTIYADASANTIIARAYGGNGGVKTGQAAAVSGAVNSHNALVYYAIYAGGAGSANEAGNGGSVSSVNVYNFSVKSNILTLAAHSGGSGSKGWGGGGGASRLANGGSNNSGGGSYGSGGGGSFSNSGSTGGGGRGGDGRCYIYY